MKTVEFLEALFGVGEESIGAILIWQLKTKRSAWFTTPAAAAAYAEGKDDVYVGCATAPTIGTERTRCAADSVSAVPGVWVDLDYHCPEAHTKTNLPPNERAAALLLAGQPEGYGPRNLEPTIVVHSGHGLQAWLLYKEPWVCETPAQRALAAQAVRAYQGAIRAAASVKGWSVDATDDLARILRIPGTWNAKCETRVMVTAEMRSDPVVPLYSGPQEIIDLCEQFRSVVREPEPEVGPFVLSPDASPPIEKMEAMLSTFIEFKKSWNQNRNDFRSHDYSPSSYSLSLASMAVKAGWSDQEIVNLVIAWRRKWGHDLKIDRKDNWYERLIVAARRTKDCGPSAIHEFSEETARTDDREDRIKQGLPVERTIDEVRAEFSKKFGGLQVVALLQRGRHDAKYALEVRDEEGKTFELQIGTNNDLHNPQVLLSKVEQYTYKPMPMHMKKAQWVREVNDMRRMILRVENDEDDPVYVFMEILGHYLDPRIAGRDRWRDPEWEGNTEEEIKIAVQRRFPYVKDRGIFLNKIDLIAHCKSIGAEYMLGKASSVQAMLSAIGFRQMGRLYGGRGKSYWRKPAGTAYDADLRGAKAPDLEAGGEKRI